MPIHPWCALGALLMLCSAAAQDTLTLADFESPEDARFASPPAVQIVGEHARHGAKALKLDHDGKGYPGLRIDEGALLKRIRDGFRDHPIFALDVFNPQDFVVSLGASAGDAQSKDYGSRYNEDGLKAPPGWSTIRINLTGLLRSNSNNFHEKKPLDAGGLTFLVVFMHPHSRGASTTLYFDHARLEGHGLPRVEGLKAFDFGPQAAPVWPGFAGVHPTHVWNSESAFGWKGGMSGWSRSFGNPDDLGGDCGAGEAFVVRVEKAGPYVVELCCDTFGAWQGTQSFRKRTVTLNGKPVLEESYDGARFMRERYLAFEDAEDTPGMDLWAERVKPLLPVRRFETTVGADGLLEVSVKTEGGWPGLLSFLVVYSKEQQTGGEGFMAALEKRRHEAFRSTVVVVTPKPDRAAPAPRAEDTARGFAPFVRSTELDINALDAPSEAERAGALAWTACPGERTAGQVGLFPLRDVKGLKVSTGGLKGPGGAEIPAAALAIHKIRYFASRGGNQMTIVPRILQPFEFLDLTPGLTRGLWLTLTLPADAKPGAYAGALVFEAAGAKAEIPLRLEVLPIRLEAADDVSLSIIGATVGHWPMHFTDLEARYWKVAEDVMRDHAAHGMNAVTGGPGMPVLSVKDGKAELDFEKADRWLALAKQHGLTQLGDSYQGLDAGLGIQRGHSPNCMEEHEARSKEKWGVGFEELIRLVYGEIARHAKEKAWPPRSFYLLDEPRPEFRNVESARQMLELHMRAAPETIFAGYYSPGDGRDGYFKLAPMSVAHHSAESLAACREAGKRAWNYGAYERHCTGRWLYAAKLQGLSGFACGGYQYVNSHAYYDFSDVEGSWCAVYPSKHGLAATVKWERAAQGIHDYRYLKTLRSSIDAAKQAGRKPEAVQAAETFLTATLKPIQVEPQSSAMLETEGWSVFRAELAKHLVALQP